MVETGHVVFNYQLSIGYVILIYQTYMLLIFISILEMIDVTIGLCDTVQTLEKSRAIVMKYEYR